MSSGVPRINRASNVPRPPHPINPTRSLSLAPKTRLADVAVHAAIPAFIDFFTKSRRSMVGPCRSGISRSCYRQQDIINSLQMPTTGLRIGFVGCVHPFYDLPPVARQRQDAIEELRRAGCEVIAAETPRTAADAVEIAARLRRSEEHTSELQSLRHLVCRLLLEKKNKAWELPAESDEHGAERPAVRDRDSS